MEFREQTRMQTRMIVININPLWNSLKSCLPKPSPISILSILILNSTRELFELEKQTGETNRVSLHYGCQSGGSGCLAHCGRRVLRPHHGRRQAGQAGKEGKGQQ